jgi:lon-related putative ATP-dependent protease
MGALQVMVDELMVESRPPQLPANTFQELPASELCRRCDATGLPFETTSELEPLEGPVGQERAVEALRFGVSMDRDGYHLFAMGPANAGKHTALRRMLEKHATTRPVPSDVCYVTNFTRPNMPRVLLLPPGRGSALRREVAQLVDDLRTAIPHALESDDFRARKQAIEDEFKQRHEKETERLSALAGEKGLAIVQTPMGLVVAPVKDGEAVPAEEFAKLPEAEREAFQQSIETLSVEVRRHAEQLPRWHQEMHRRIRELVRQTVRAAVSHLIDDLKTRFQELSAVVEHLSALGDQVLDHADDFVKEGDEGSTPTLPDSGEPGDSPRRRYEVNLLVSNEKTAGAPVVYEDHPTVDRLLGRVEHRSQFGTLVTDLHLVKPGALHRANGGYLLLDARELLSQPYAWEALKRALLAKELRVESLGQMMSLVTTVSLEPEPVPLDVKVVLLGERRLMYLLESIDPDFDALFKVAVDFEDDVERSPANDALYARMLAAVVRDEKLRPVARGGVAAVLDRCARLAGDSGKLSASMGPIVDLLREADHFAQERSATLIDAADVEGAVAAKERRAGRLRERLLEQIREGTLMIETNGSRVGQVNGLSVIDLGHFAFGHPTRITARVRLGQGRVLDIEREAELGGPIHSKGVMILAGLLAGRYAREHPLSLSATLVFEQSYGQVEGDSASSAELYALLSALAQAPVSQAIAVTGSVNQHGAIQPVGGVNEKIEGFFDVCRARGLTGINGVIVPEANVRHLMLRREVVEAVRQKRFHVWPVRTIDEGIELLTGVPAGERDGEGRFPPGTLNAQVEDCLLEFARRRERTSQGLNGRA